MTFDINFEENKFNNIDINFDYSKVAGSTEMHNKFKKELIICVSKQFENVRIIPYDVAFVRAYSQPDICFSVGQVGVPDTIILGNGWYLLLDTKTGKARLSKEQLAFKKQINLVNEGKDRVFKVTKITQAFNLIQKEIENEQ